MFPLSFVLVADWVMENKERRSDWSLETKEAGWLSRRTTNLEIPTCNKSLLPAVDILPNCNDDDNDS